MQCWRVPPALAKAWWRGLSRSQDRVPRTWLHDLTVFGGTHLGTLEHFLCQTCPPSRIMAVLEALAAEGRLTRVQASRIEDVVLTYVTRAGQWKAGAYDPHRLQPEETYL
jgi:hypothetical protein